MSSQQACTDLGVLSPQVVLAGNILLDTQPPGPKARALEFLWLRVQGHDLEPWFASLCDGECLALDRVINQSGFDRNSVLPRCIFFHLFQYVASLLLRENSTVRPG